MRARMQTEPHPSQFPSLRESDLRVNSMRRRDLPASDGQHLIPDNWDRLDPDFFEEAN